MLNEQTCIHFMISLLFSKFPMHSCHLKDLGERNASLTALMDEFENRVMYGEEANLGDFPFIVQFFNFGGMCGGCILTRKTILTAAHCFDHNKNVAEMNIISNALYKFDRKSRRHEVWEFTLHEFYNFPYKYSNDIALITIRDRLTFGPTVQRAVLTKSRRWMTESETNFVAMGWGITEGRRQVLKKIRLRYISPQNCTKMSGLSITKDMFCLFGDEKADTCRGDSGGGVLWEGFLVGIVSHGRGCLRSPSVYVNLPRFRSWIRSTVSQMHLSLLMFRFYSFLILLCLSCYGNKLDEEKDVNNVLGDNSNRYVDVEGKIVGGKAVSLREFPSVALFFNMRAMCAATILNSWTVMTAAHCFDPNKDKDDMVVEVGARYVYDFKAKQHEVDYYVVHNKYNIDAEFASDIALIFVKEPIKFSDKIKKAIIADTNSWMNPREKHFKATGWGWTKYGGPPSENGLLMAELEYVSSKTCSQLHQIVLSPDMFCLYGNATKDTCKGDSGGGILWNNMVVGITSHGDGCAKKRKPSVFINVWYYRDWIKEEIRKFVSQYCIRHNEDLKRK